jgi:hypothetical protein
MWFQLFRHAREGLATFANLRNEVLDRVMAAQCYRSAETRAPATVGNALPENAMERVDIATDQIGFPDGDERETACGPFAPHKRLPCTRTGSASAVAR